MTKDKVETGEKRKIGDDLENRKKNVKTKYKFDKDSLKTLSKSEESDKIKMGIKSEFVGKKNEVKLKDMKLKFKTYEEVFDEKCVPNGWKVIEVPHYMPQNEGIAINLRKFVNPKGITFSRPKACGYLEKQKEWRNFEIMKQGLIVDGWSKSFQQCDLPEGFYFRRHNNQACYFILPGWGTLKSIKKYQEFLIKHNYDPKYIENSNFIKKTTVPLKEKIDSKEFKSDLSKSKVESSLFKTSTFEVESSCWISDSSLPEGWKKLDNVDHTKFRDPSGSVFENKIAAISEMITKDYDPEIIYKCWNTLDKDEWKLNFNLPAGWRIKTREDGGIMFLSPMMEVFNSMAALMVLIQTKDYFTTEEAVKLLKFLNKQNYNDL